MAADIVKNGVYFIQNFASSTVIDLKKTPTLGTGTQGSMKCELSDQLVPQQLWIISRAGSDPIYTIQNAKTRDFLSLAAADDRTPVELYSADNRDYQKWMITRANNGTAYVICNKATGTYVELFTEAVNGTAIKNWAGHGVGTTNAHQLWHIVRA